MRLIGPSAKQGYTTKDSSLKVAKPWLISRIVGLPVRH